MFGHEFKPSLGAPFWSALKLIHKSLGKVRYVSEQRAVPSCFVPSHGKVHEGGRAAGADLRHPKSETRCCKSGLSKSRPRYCTTCRPDPGERSVPPVRWPGRIREEGTFCTALARTVRGTTRWPGGESSSCIRYFSNLDRIGLLPMILANGGKKAWPPGRVLPPVRRSNSATSRCPFPVSKGDEAVKGGVGGRSCRCC